MKRLAFFAAIAASLVASAAMLDGIAARIDARVITVGALSSFKEKHRYMNEGLDLIKIKRLAVINLNNMFPVPPSQIVNFDIKKVKDQKYKALLQREYRVIASIEDKICENAGKLYEYKIEKGDSTPLAERCNDFLLLEEKAIEFISKSVQGHKL